MRIAILGTRGIPNQYGGFEQFAEKFAISMAGRGHQVFVYSSHNHPYSGSELQQVRLIHCFDPEYRMGTAGQFIYDLNCILDSRKRGFDIILQLGYTSSTVWSWLMPGGSLVVTNMDGLEWKRTKYGRMTRWFLRHAEKWGARYSNYLIADSKAIKDYLWDKYQISSLFVPYGAEVFEAADSGHPVFGRLGIVPGSYDLLIARFEPENNIALALQAYRSNGKRKLVLVGNHEHTRFGKRCSEQYGKCGNIIFAGPIYNSEDLQQLRCHAALYIHGHSVGGTNPSLLEAMGCGVTICAHDNVFNRSTLCANAHYFNTAGDLEQILADDTAADKSCWREENLKKVRECYNWETITDKLEQSFQEWISMSN